jgi:hypothetical protein
MTIYAEQLTVFRVFLLVIAVRFGWCVAGLLLDQVDHWIDLLLAWIRARR